MNEIKKSNFPELTLSGVQPTGNLHLGNYLGAIKQWVKIQNERNCLFCVVDMHAITVPQDPAELRQNTLDLTAAYIACGIDVSKAKIFVQSAVAEHAELAWIFSCMTPLGWLNRMTQFKEKAGKVKDNAPLGLYSYPVLMAADILLYNATHVPVGDDQKQHLELTRDIAQSINAKYGYEVFPMPEPLILAQAKRVMSLRDGTKKMSKSDASDASRINLSDDKDAILNKFKKATTDAEPMIFADVEKRPSVTNLLNIYSELSGRSIEDICGSYGENQFGKFKTDLAEVAAEKLSPITNEYNRLKKDEAYLRSVLKDGNEKAKEIASKNIERVKDLVGFLKV